MNLGAGYDAAFSVWKPIEHLYVWPVVTLSAKKWPQGSWCCKVSKRNVSKTSRFGK